MTETAYIAKGRRSGQPVIGTWDSEHFLCCWDVCEKQGTTLYRVRIYEGVHPQNGGPIYSWKIFCSERHKMYYTEAPRNLYNLPAGYRRSVI